jgi:hypothetical protein
VPQLRRQLRAPADPAVAELEEQQLSRQGPREHPDETPARRCGGARTVLGRDQDDTAGETVSPAAPWLIAASAAIVLLLGLLHLAYTFRGRKLHPRDPELLARMQQVSPVISRETTMWKAWIGFNASHSYGAILFGAVYGYLAVVHSAFLFGTPFLLLLGLALLGGYAFLGKAYWFSVPSRAILVATALYAASLAARWA